MDELGNIVLRDGRHRYLWVWSSNQSGYSLGVQLPSVNSDIELN